MSKHGKFVRNLDDDESYTVKDRESIRFNLQFMDAMPVFDSVGHRPGAVTLTDSERDRRAQMYADNKARISDAWKNAPPLAADIAPTPIRTGDALEDAYEARSRRLRGQRARRVTYPSATAGCAFQPRLHSDTASTGRFRA